MRCPMRFQPLIFLIALVISMSTHAGDWALGANLSQAAVDGLKGPAFTKQELPYEDENFLVITRDYGSGIEIREAYVYLQNAEKQWDIVAYRRTNSSHLVASISNDRLQLIAKSGRILLEVPLKPFGFRFDPKEH